MEIPIKCFGCDGIPKIFDNARFIYGKLLPNKEDKDMEFPEESTGLRERKQARQHRMKSGGDNNYGNYGPRAMATDATIGRQGLIETSTRSDPKLSPTPKNSPHTGMTLLASLKTR
jgi:hypothetical protein